MRDKMSAAPGVERDSGVCLAAITVLAAWAVLLLFVVVGGSMGLPGYVALFALFPVAMTPIVWLRPRWAGFLLLAGAIVLPVVAVAVALAGYDTAAGLDNMGNTVSRQDTVVGTAMGSAFGLALPSALAGMLALLASRRPPVLPPPPRGWGQRTN